MVDGFRYEPQVALDVGDGILGLELEDAIADAPQQRARERARVGAGEHDVGSELEQFLGRPVVQRMAPAPRSRTTTPRDRPRANLP